MPDENKPRKLNMADMLRSSNISKAFLDALEAPKPDPYTGMSAAQREVHEYKDKHDCSLSQAAAAVRAERARRDRREECESLLNQLSEAESVEDLKPIMQMILEKLWS